MIISEKQIMQLLQVLVDSLCIVDGNSPFKYSREDRRDLAVQILHPQPEELGEIE